ncbi:MAG: rubrerythrin family protein [Deltaproteobacteria bacterium]|nr:rubrerythrin family protein [Deltaproteobacteria bacterium]
MSKTDENLKQAFAGECQASVRYMAFAEKAEVDGFPGLAKLFRAASKAEMVHALSHLRASRVVNETAANLEAAVEGETFEFKQMYPAMVKDAVQENEIDARHSFEYAMSIEMVHAKLFKKAMEEEILNSEANYYVCPVCGHTVRGKAPKKCPYCGVDEKKFIEIQ